VTTTDRPAFIVLTPDGFVGRLTQHTFGIVNLRVQAAMFDDRADAYAAADYVGADPEDATIIAATVPAAPTVEDLIR